MIAHRHRPLALLVWLSSVQAAPLSAQLAGPGSWNHARVLELVESARAARQSVAVDSSMSEYQADARGYVYFFVDRPDREDHMLVKADQVALELYWRAPDDARQRIVGLRDEKVLPTSIRYHLDHLTVVQDDYGDRIRLGDGDEVEAVIHPVAPGSSDVYDFQLADSLRLSYGLEGAEVRVYEIRVRPKRMDRPGYVGTLFVDRDTGAIVRMNFSFTPASYVDQYLDYIRISLDNSLWMGRFWLPYRQEVEVRREMPLLDFSAGSVIRTRFEIREYDFEPVLDEGLFALGRVTTVPPSQRVLFPFEQGLFDQVDEEGLSTSATIEDVRVQVREVVEEDVLSGLSPIRFYLDGLSDFARYNRAEGAYVGAGVTIRPWGDARLRGLAGYAFGRERPSGSLTLELGEGRWAPTISGYWDELADIGGNPGAEMLLNTITALSGSKDYLDPYFRRGGRIAIGRGNGLSAAVRVEEHLSARDVVSDSLDTEFRPIGLVHEGTFGALSLSLGLGTAEGVGGRLTGTAGRLGEMTSLAAEGEIEIPFGNRRDGWSGRILGEGGVTNPDGPIQTMYLIGGRHTLPGQDYRAFMGNAYWLLRAETTVPVRPPYLGLRTFGVMGGTHLGDVDALEGWPLQASDGIRGSVGLGLSLFWDAVFFDVAHGVRGGGWEAVVSVAERFAGWM